MKIIYLPRAEELGYNLDMIPKDPEHYKKSMELLAKSIKEYSKQIEDLCGSLGEGENDGEPE